jgi:hypothetical protein
MPYPRSTQKISEILSRILDRADIAAEIEKKGIRRQVIEQEALQQAGRIWESVSSRVEAHDLAEQAMGTTEQRFGQPIRPAYLSWITRASWTILTTLFLILVAAAIVSFFKGWRTTESYLLRVGSWRTWAFILANLALLFGLLRYLYRRGDRLFEDTYRKLRVAHERQLKPLQDELAALRKLADESLGQAINSEVLEILASRTSQRYGVALPVGDSEGLSQVENPEFEITTPSAERLKRIIGAVNGASIGISGSRGAGKTTLPLSQYHIGNTKPNVLSVFTSAPVEYDAREFVLHLFASVCSRIIEKAVGRQDVQEKQAILREREAEAADSRWRRNRTPFARLMDPSVRSFLLMGFFLAYLGFSLAFLKVEAGRRSPPPGATSAPVPMLNAIVDAMGFSPGILFGLGVAVTTFGILGRPYIRAWREREYSAAAGSRPDRVELEYESELAHRGPHVLAAHRHLSTIRFQQSFTSGWSGSLKLPIALEGAIKSDRSWSEKPRTLPDIVDDYRRYLEQIVGSDNNPYDQVLICIDELDKLPSDEVAQRFLNGIKSVFNQKRCYYLVSVSENAMSSFERRGLPIRDTFDSSFDEVIYVDYLPLTDSKRLLSRRVLNLPDPFVCFAHILSGGLPRDLLRVTRAMFDARALGVPNRIGEICSFVLSADLQTKFRAVAVAADRISDLPKSFVGEILSAEVWTREQIWRLIARLRAYQHESKDGVSEPSSNGSEGASSSAPLPLEALMVAFFYVTLLEIFEKMDQVSWTIGEQKGLFDRMAAIRRSLSQDPMTTANAIDAVRAEFSLLSSEECLHVISVEQAQGEV